MEFTVRELEFGDIFTATKIFKKVNIKPMIKEFGSIDLKDKTPEDIEKIQNEKGFELLMYIFENIDGVELEICRLMADLTGVKIEDVKKFKFADIKRFYDQLVSVNSAGEIMSFFKSAVGSKR